MPSDKSITIIQYFTLILINGGLCLTNSIPDHILLGLSEIKRFSQKDLKQLHALEYNKFTSLKNSKRKNEYVASRLLMKALASKKKIPSLFVAHLPKDGSPYGIQKKDGKIRKWELSISHSKKWVCCALSDTTHPVGVDMEPVSRRIPEQLRKRFLHENEREKEKEQCLVEQEPVIKLWTLKEAVVKLLKTGLRTNLNSLELKRLEQNVFNVQYRSKPDIQVVSFKKQEHYIALAYYKDE